jgi:hypothetical protein
MFFGSKMNAGLSGKWVLVAAIGAMSLMTSAVHATPAAGSFTFNIAPDGAGNVVVTGSGNFLLTGSNSNGTDNGYSPNINPNGDVINNGPSSSSFSSLYWLGGTGPASFGSGSYSFANSGTGDFVDFDYLGGGLGEAAIGVPTKYASGASLSDTAVYNNTTLAGMGLTPGASYTWTWPAGTSTDTVTINVASVPEPTSIGLLAVTSAGLLARRRRKAGCVGC